MLLVAVSIERLREAGYKVSPAEGVLGLWDVAGLARDVTSSQLIGLASRHGAPLGRLPARFIVVQPA